ncbi:hypothetical protein B0P06_000584 [Clostridium saccharoperbutylacetonicum]|uniref:Uncharacterized protein n=1 Tax=Clostridium saccharoperbutylacetonicum N1-4(HMT) TaxID=931276 RepID=M1LR14_9CLOT|nr:hypothetical protein [Clostridium saccharoperbutylacetonicum]AGF55330.1 hypothetical protein Cspa_c15600 [Clostridium saccharoperbutylacetonicum N1-4(HMT)]NRT63957.1 hypothetical protein [Clostridium saccharoperbutylacetonicum]NSB27324.1 hypothetical protein [Clostridium saccharoperbutylacetonicum]NSB40813.1 hypothetical protein [Clostridium saccharoperbutylacetonicum]
MKKIQLPKPTSQCEEEPYVQMNNSMVIIRYSYEDERLSSVISIKFKIIYSFTYTECEYMDTSDYTFGLVEIDNSRIKSDLLTVWDLKNRPIDEAFGGEVEKIKHYRLYFDDYGMYDIICKNIQIGEEVK